MRPAHRLADRLRTAVCELDRTVGSAAVASVIRAKPIEEHACVDAGVRHPTALESSGERRIDRDDAVHEPPSACKVDDRLGQASHEEPVDLHDLVCIERRAAPNHAIARSWHCSARIGELDNIRTSTHIWETPEQGGGLVGEHNTIATSVDDGREPRPGSFEVGCRGPRRCGCNNSPPYADEVPLGDIASQCAGRGHPRLCVAPEKKPDGWRIRIEITHHATVLHGRADRCRPAYGCGQRRPLHSVEDEPARAVTFGQRRAAEGQRMAESDPWARGATTCVRRRGRGRRGTGRAAPTTRAGARPRHPGRWGPRRAALRGGSDRPLPRSGRASRRGAP